MNTIQRSRLIQLIKQHFPYTEPCDVEHALQWEIIAETLNALGPAQAIDEWIEDWETIKNTATNKLKTIKSLESEQKEIPDDLKLTEEDHRILKICGFENNSNKMAKLVKMLDCRAESPFEDESSGSGGSDNEEEKEKSEVEEYVKNENGNDDAVKTSTDRKIALAQLEEQKKINMQLSELLAILKTPAQ